MDFSPEQIRFSHDLSKSLSTPHYLRNPTFRIMSSAPGSGKTTTLLNALSSFVLDNPSFVDEMIEKEEQILILVFNAKNKKELLYKVKKAGLPDIFKISTINSLLFQELKRLTTTSTVGRGGTSKLSSFSLDYTRSTFTKPMIRFVLESLIVGNIYQSPSRGFSEIDGEALPRIDSISTEKKLSKNRFLPLPFLSGKNIDVLWSFVNGYFSSHFHAKDIDNIAEVASFFGKSEVSLGDLVLNEETLSALNLTWGNTKSPEDYVSSIFNAVLFRISELSSFMGEIHTRTFTSDVDIEYSGYDNIDSDVYSIDEHDVSYENIFKVPHNFYTKQAYRLIMSNDEVMRDIFSKFLALLNDESQDNDFISYSIAESLCSKGIIKDVSFIGDTHQSIYGFASPDHFDVLEYTLSHQEEIKKKGISLVMYNLNKSYRLGESASEFCNKVFGSSIIGNEGSNDFIYPVGLREENLPDVIGKLTSINKKASCAIICRTNSEATRLFIYLKEKGMKVKIESSIKQEISAFFKKGLSYISEDDVRQMVLSELVSFYGKREKDVYSYGEIKGCYSAVDILCAHGYSQIIKFSASEVEDYILPRDNSRTGIIWIGTAHLFKGSEYDYCILGTDFFSKGLNSSTGGDVQGDPLESTLWNDLHELLSDRKNKEEKNILYVAMTRCKLGLFFLLSPLSESILASGFIDKKKSLKRYKELTEVDEVKPLACSGGNISPVEVKSPAPLSLFDY